MLLTALIISAILLSVAVNTVIKNWVVKYILLDELEDVKDDEDVSSSVVFTTIGLVLVNNMIPFTLGAIIGLYAIM